MKNIIIIGLGLLLLSACEDKTVKTDNNLAKKTIDEQDTTVVVKMPTDTIFYAIKGFDRQIDSCVSDSINCASFVASFPLIEKRVYGEIADSVNNFVRENLYKPLMGNVQPNGLNDLLAPYFQAYQETLQTSQNEGEDSISAWAFKRLFTVIHNDYRLFTIKHFEHSYAGGAHANSFTHYHHFNPVSGKKIYLDDVFIQGYKNKLIAIAEKKFRAQLKIGENANLDDEGFWFTGKVFSITENFWLDSIGIHFLYNPYEVAAYTVGTIEIEIGYNEIEEIIKDKFNPFVQYSNETINQ